MDIARSLAALDELPEATVAIAAVRDDAGNVVDFVFEYANLVAAGVARAPSGSELVGRRLLEALPALPRELFARFVAAVGDGVAMRTQIDYGDPRAAAGDSSTRFEVSASPFGDGLLVVYEDIGARSRSEATQRRYRAILDATSDWVSIADRDNTILYVNPAGRRMVGIGPRRGHQRVGGWATSRRRGRAGGCSARALAAARRDGAWRADLARLHRDGHEIPVSQVIVAQLAADGEVDFYAAIARDMTRERAAEAALRESEERFRVTFEQAPIGDLAHRPRGSLSAGQRRVLPHRRALARGAPAARARGDHASRRRRPTRAMRSARSRRASCRWCASRSATSTRAATRSGSR